MGSTRTTRRLLGQARGRRWVACPKKQCCLAPSVQFQARRDVRRPSRSTKPIRPIVNRSSATLWTLRIAHSPPVHAFWLVGKLVRHVRASAQPHSDLLRFPKPPQMGRSLLACVGKPIAVTAGEQASGSVQLGDLATAIHPVCSDRTHKPGPLATEPARRPGDGHTLSTSLQSSPYERLWYFRVTEWRWVSTLMEAILLPSLVQAHENHRGDRR
jgi:hypothetical protein